jgi:hypothetical protein
MSSAIWRERRSTSAQRRYEVGRVWQPGHRFRDHEKHHQNFSDIGKPRTTLTLINNRHMSEATTALPARSPVQDPKPASTRTATTPVAWIAGDDLALDEWARDGRRLGLLTRCSPWWLGDWIRYGNTRFGEKYSRASAITGYDRQTLMNMVYVASRYEISRRRESLSWSHHETLASLEPTEQDSWLGRAVEQKLSVADLRVEIRGHKRTSDTDPDGKAESELSSDDPASITCPKCGHPISPSLLEATSRDRI